MAARTCSKPTIPVQARRRESMEMDGSAWSDQEDPTKPRSKTRMKARGRLQSVAEEVVLVSEYDPRREEE